ncbi:MAG: SPOR domain-containing protein [Bacteroides sp.]|nr:SPOR domain-containing protein [Bacteroides sp.]
MRNYLFYLCLLLLSGSSLSATAQERNIVRDLQRYEPGQGRVTIHQDPRLEALVGRQNPAGDGVLKVSGYRVQVYAGNNSREARDQAQNTGNRVKNYFPEMKVYTSFISPRWLCRVGDFRSIEEANAAMRMLKSTGVFREVSIVKEQINIQL